MPNEAEGQRVWHVDEAVEEVKEGSSQRRFLVGNTAAGPVYMKIKEGVNLVYADEINLDPRGVAVTNRGRERVLYFSDDVRRAVHSIRDMSESNEVEILRGYSDVLSVGGRDHYYMKDGAEDELKEEADTRILAEYRNVAMKLERIADKVDESMSGVVNECAGEIRAAIDADRRFR